MADLTQASLTWNANTEPDLAGYKLWAGQVFSTVTTGPWSITQDLSAGVTSTVITSGSFNNDGVWYFALQAKDTSNNFSPLTTPVSKRIVRVQSKMRHRR